MWKQFTVQGNTVYIDIILPKILELYNNTKHSSIKMTPIEASKKKNESNLYFNLHGDMERLPSKPNFKVGDKVRISNYKRKVFDKGYTPNWTEEIFLIDKIQSTNPITYRLKALNNEEIQGSFFEPDLLKAKQDIFRIDKVIWRDYKKTQALHTGDFWSILEPPLQFWSQQRQGAIGLVGRNRLDPGHFFLQAWLLI